MKTTGLARVFAVAAAGSVALAGCDVSGGSLTLATGSTGGTYYPLGGEMAALWSNSLEDVNVSTQATGASVENLRLLDQGENDIVMAVNGIAAQAVAGEGDFEEESLSNAGDIMALGNVYPEVMQVVATEESGIESIEDLAGARVEIGPAGSGTEIVARQILEAHGIDPENDLGEVLQNGFDDAATMMGDGNADAAFGILGLPAGSITELSVTTDIVMLDITGAPLEELLSSDPTLSEQEIPADTYDGQSEPKATITNWATLYVRSDFDEDMAYEMVKTLYEGAGDMEHGVAEQIQLDTATDGLGDIPLHPGAERYYEEEGVLD